MDMWQKIQVFFKECMEEKAMAKGTEKGEKILESMESLDFLQQKGRVSEHL